MTEFQEPLEPKRAELYRSAVGSAIYLSLDERILQFSVKELARRLSKPLEVDWMALKHLGRFLLSHETARITLVTDEDRQHYAEGGSLRCFAYTDSDWAGCPETRRSTGCVVTGIQSSVCSVTTQTQTGLPASSSGDAELREMSRGAREVLYLKQLAELDFGLRVSLPELFADSSVGITTSRKLGPGSKLKHLEVCHFYIQVAQRMNLLTTKKVKGTSNPANWNTKHHTSPKEVTEAMPSLGMLSIHHEAITSALEECKEIHVSAMSAGEGWTLVAKPKAKKMPWKPPLLIPTTLQIAAIAQLVMQTRGEEHGEVSNKNLSCTPEQSQAQELSRDWVPLILMMLGVLYLVQLSVALMKTIKGFFTALQAGALEPEAELEPTITAEDQDQRAEPPGAEAPHGEATRRRRNGADPVVHITDCSVRRRSVGNASIAIRICRLCEQQARRESGSPALTHVYVSETALANLAATRATGT